MPEVTACNLCGGCDVLAVTKRRHGSALPAGLAIVECQRCGLAFMSPRPTQEEYKRFYESHEFYAVEAYLQRELARKDFYMRRVAQLRAALGPRNRLLEIGCATGYFLKLAREAGFDVHGTELSERFADYASREFGLDVRCVGDLRRAALPEASFDMVYANHVLEHVLDPVATLREAWRILDRGGLLLVEVPNQFDSLRDRLRRWVVALSPASAKGILYNEPTSLHHAYFFSAPTLRRMVELVGFTPLRLKTYERHHRQVMGDAPIGGYWLTEVMHRFGSVFGLGPILLVWAEKTSLLYSV